MLGKSSLLKCVLLPVLVIITLILLIVSLWILYRKIRKNQHTGVKAKVKTELPLFPPEFTIPYSVRTMTEQLPVISVEQESIGENTEKCIGVKMGRRGAAGIQSDSKEWNQTGLEKRHSSQLELSSMVDPEFSSIVGSFSSTEMDPNAKSAACEGDISSFRANCVKDRQRRISRAMIYAFREEGRKVSLTKPVKLHDGGGNLEALSAALTAVESEPLSPRERSSQSDSEFNGEAADTFGNDSFPLKKRMAARRGKDYRKKFIKTGQVSFATTYFSNEQKLEVMIIRAFDLRKRREGGELNPFLRLYLLPGKRQKQHTRVRRRTNEPYFNEKRVFYDLSLVELASNRLKLKVYNRETIAKNDLLGETEIALSSLNQNEKQSFSMDLFLRKDQLNTQIMVSLCHNAANSELDVSIHKARGLPKFRKIGFPDTYCRLYLFREDGMERQTTKIKRNNHNPIWDEKHTFKVATSSSQPLQMLSLAITLISNSILSKDEVIGHVIFSLDSSQDSAVSHWQQVNDCPHRSITNWHTLTEPEEL